MELAILSISIFETAFALGYLYGRNKENKFHKQLLTRLKDLEKRLGIEKD